MSSHRRTQVAIGVCFVMVALSLLLVAVALVSSRATARKVERARLERLAQVNRINQAQCASLRNLYSVIQQTLVESDKRIDAIDYYRHHPGERARAHHANLAIIERFRQPPCPRDISLAPGGS